MSFPLRLCKNETTSYLRDTFRATPLLVPEARVKPLMVVAHRRNDTQFRGELRYLLTDPDWTFGLQDQPVSATSLDRTRKVDASLGLQILQGFLQGLNAGSAPVRAAISGTKTVSLSFHNVRRQYADLNALGLALVGRTLNLTHPSMGVFLSDDPYELLLVSDVIVSNAFTLNNESGTDADFGASIPALQDYVAKAETDLRHVTNNKSSITFEGDQPLTFAFSCVRLGVDRTTGALQVLESIDVRGDGPGAALPQVLLDDDAQEPGLLTFDERPFTA